MVIFRYNSIINISIDLFDIRKFLFGIEHLWNLIRFIVASFR